MIEILTGYVLVSVVLCLIMTLTGISTGGMNMRNWKDWLTIAALFVVWPVLVFLIIADSVRDHQEQRRKRPPKKRRVTFS